MTKFFCDICDKEAQAPAGIFSSFGSPSLLMGQTPTPPVQEQINTCGMCMDCTLKVKEAIDNLKTT